MPVCQKCGVEMTRAVNLRDDASGIKIASIVFFAISVVVAVVVGMIGRAAFGGGASFGFGIHTLLGGLAALPIFSHGMKLWKNAQPVQSFQCPNCRGWLR